MGDCASCASCSKEKHLDSVAQDLLPTKPPPKSTETKLKLDFVTSDHSYNRFTRYDPDQEDTKVVERPAPSPQSHSKALRVTFAPIHSAPTRLSIQYLIGCGAMVSIYVPSSASDRWMLSKRLVKRIKTNGGLHQKGATILSLENNNSLFVT